MFQQHKIKLIAASIAFYLLLLLSNLPAVQVLNRITLPDNIQIKDVQGSLWQGQAQSLFVDGIQVKDVNWNLSFLPLILGTASAQVKAGNNSDPDSISFNGDVEMSLSGERIRLVEADLRLPAPMVIAKLPLPIPVKAGGRFNISIEQLDYWLAKHECQDIVAKGKWLNAKVQGINGFIEFGEFNADIACVNTNVQITIKPQNLLGLNAIATLNNKGQFSVSGKFKPAPQLPKEVHQTAIIFGRTDSEGYYSIAL